MMENEVTVARGKRKEESFELVEISAVVFSVWWHELLEFCGLSPYEVLRGVDWNEGLSNDFPRATIFRDDLAGILWGDEKFTTLWSARVFREIFVNALKNFYSEFSEVFTSFGSFSGGENYWRYRRIS